MEHIVPNIEWASEKIVAGEMDGHVLNVLYGAQEAQGYERELNTHYFGYTPAIARAMAEEIAGLIDVEVRTYHQDEALGYNMMIVGEKPNAD